MKKIRNLVKEYFSLSEKEANGFVGLSLFMVVALSSPWIYKYYQESTLDPDPFVQTQEDFFVEIHKAHQAKQFYPKDSVPPFNPNQTGLKEWQKMGVRDEIAHRIEKYKAKGGKFAVKSDLMKIYGFPEDLYFQLNEYILLPDSIIHQKETYQRTVVHKEQSKPININKATAEDLLPIRGIGSVLSARIIKFRDALGGFVKKEQIYEVYGLDSLVAEKLAKGCTITKDFKPKSISFDAPYKSIAGHPYISWKAARILESYYQEHGISSLEDLQRSKALSQKEVERILPYLSLSEAKDSISSSGH